MLKAACIKRAAPSVRDRAYLHRGDCHGLPRNMPCPRSRPIAGRRSSDKFERRTPLCAPGNTTSMSRTPRKSRPICVRIRTSRLPPISSTTRRRTAARAFRSDRRGQLSARAPPQARAAAGMRGEGNGHRRVAAGGPGANASVHAAQRLCAATAGQGRGRECARKTWPITITNCRSTGTG